MKLQRIQESARAEMARRDLQKEMDEKGEVQGRRSRSHTINSFDPRGVSRKDPVSAVLLPSDLASIQERDW